MSPQRHEHDPASSAMRTRAISLCSRGFRFYNRVKIKPNIYSQQIHAQILPIRPQSLQRSLSTKKRRSSVVHHTAQEIEAIHSLVDQLENTPELYAPDVELLIEPLMRQTANMVNGAALTLRILQTQMKHCRLHRDKPPLEDYNSMPPPSPAQWNRLLIAHVDDPHQAQVIFDSLDDPQRIHRKSMIRAYTKAQQPAQAEQFMSDEDNDMDMINMILRAWAQDDVLDLKHIWKLAQRRPKDDWDAFTYHALFKAHARWLKVGRTVDPLQVDDLLHQWQDYHNRRAFQEDDFQIDLRWAFGISIHAWLPTNPTKALEWALQLSQDHRTYPSDELLDKLVQSTADRAKVERLIVNRPHSREYFRRQSLIYWGQSSYTRATTLVEEIARGSPEPLHALSIQVIQRAWLRCPLLQAPVRAEDWLHELRENYYLQGQRTEYMPREIHVRYALTAWLNVCGTGSAYRGYQGVELFPAQHMENILLQYCREPWMKPAMLSGLFALAIKGWGMQKGTQDNLDNAFVLLNQLELLLDKLPAFPSNAVLKLCTETESDLSRRQESYHSAIDLYHRCESNARTLVLMVQVIRAQADMDATNQETIELVFQEACHKGWVTQELIWELVAVLPSNSLQRLFGISHQYAEAIIDTREAAMSNWKRGCKAPPALLVSNLPQEWSDRMRDKFRRGKPS